LSGLFFSYLVSEPFRKARYLGGEEYPEECIQTLKGDDREEEPQGQIPVNAVP